MSRDVVDALQEEEDREIEAEVQAQIEAEEAALAARAAGQPILDGEKTSKLPTEDQLRMGASIDIPVPIPEAGSPEARAYWEERRTKLREAARHARATSSAIKHPRPAATSSSPPSWIWILLILAAAGALYWWLTRS
jgi:hypothetical protein